MIDVVTVRRLWRGGWGVFVIVNVLVSSDSYGGHKGNGMARGSGT